MGAASVKQNRKNEKIIFPIFFYKIFKQYFVSLTHCYTNQKKNFNGKKLRISLFSLRTSFHVKQQKRTSRMLTN